MVQDTVWAMTMIGMGFVTAVFIFVCLRSGHPADAGRVKALLYGIRPWWFALLICLIAIGLMTTLPGLPYADTHGRASGPPDLTVDVTAHQWYWELSQPEIPAGRDIAFRVQSADVNHSFGIYDENDRLLVQTQAMPGYTNIVRHTFATPGTYKILCLEYCGVAHHVMMTDLTVTAADQTGEHR